MGTYLETFPWCGLGRVWGTGEVALTARAREVLGGQFLSSNRQSYPQAGWAAPSPTKWLKTGTSEGVAITPTEIWKIHYKWKMEQPLAEWRILGSPKATEHDHDQSIQLTREMVEGKVLNSMTSWCCCNNAKYVALCMQLSKHELEFLHGAAEPRENRKC